MFASHPSQTLSLPRPTQDIPASWLVSTIDNALAALHSGAVHINCPFAEPLYGDMDETGIARSSASATGGRTINPGCEKRVGWKATNNATGLSGDKTRRSHCGPHERGRR